MFIVKNKWIFLSLSIVLVSASLILIFTQGLRRGIDFTGGTEVVVAYNGFSANEDGSIKLDLIKENLEKSGFTVKGVSLQKRDTAGAYIVSIKLTGDVPPSERVNFENAWSFNHDPHYEAKQISENIIGPSVGKELTRKAFLSVFWVFVVIIIFIAFSFRKVSEPVASWKYGVLAVAALLHDIILPTGMYAILGKTHGAEIDSLFVLALLTIMAISISDTVVVFDRIRENLKKRKSNETFEEIVGRSLSQTLLRSFNTSFAVTLVLITLYALGPLSTRDFSLTLLVGIIAGTYSSLFVASPVLVLVEKFQNRNKIKNKKKKKA